MLLLLFGLLAFLRRKVEWGTGWVWPVPSIRTRDGSLYHAVISDGVGSSRGAGRIHRGVDIMFKRKSPADRPEFRSGTTDGTPLFFAPQVPIVAAREGTIWSAGKTPYGWSVVIDHGRPFATYYTHMVALSVAPHERGKSVINGQVTKVKAGDVIGVMGFSPTDAQKLRHLHFSVAYDGPPESHAVDPEEAMREWARPRTVDI